MRLNGHVRNYSSSSSLLSPAWLVFILSILFTKQFWFLETINMIIIRFVPEVYAYSTTTTTTTTSLKPNDPSSFHRLAKAASLSYLPLSKMKESPYYSSSQLQPILQVVDPMSESGATVFQYKNDNPKDNDKDDSSLPSQQQSSLIVSCRGSASLKNFATNLQFQLVRPERELLSCLLPLDENEHEMFFRNAKVHKGFQEASLGLWRLLGPPLLETIIQQQQQQEEASLSSSLIDVTFTGHSLGAATALLCAVQYINAVKNDNNMSRNAQLNSPPSVITFGGPKLCNGVLADYLRKDVFFCNTNNNNNNNNNNVLHLVHDQDPILANNKQLWNNLGMEHVGMQVQCESKKVMIYNTQKEYMENKRNLLPLAWNIMDHCNYLGVFVGPRLIFGE